MHQNCVHSSRHIYHFFWWLKNCNQTNFHDQKWSKIFGCPIFLSLNWVIELFSICPKKLGVSQTLLIVQSTMAIDLVIEKQFVNTQKFWVANFWSSAVTSVGNQNNSVAFGCHTRQLKNFGRKSSLKCENNNSIVEWSNIIWIIGKNLYIYNNGDIRHEGAFLDVYKRTKWYVKICCMKILNVDVPWNRFCEIMLLDEKRFMNFFYLDENLTRSWIKLLKGEKDKRANNWCWSFLLFSCCVFVFWLLHVYNTRKMDGVALVCFISWRQSSEWLVCLPMLVFNDGRNCCGNSMKKWEKEAPWWKDKHLGILVVVVQHKYVWVCLFVVRTFYEKMVPIFRFDWSLELFHCTHE